MQLIREEASAANDDAVVGKVSSQRFVIENLKHVYFNASHESTAVAASWCLMLLALQSRVAIPFMRRVGTILQSKHGLADTNSIAN